MKISLHDRKLALASIPWIALCQDGHLGRCEELRGAAPLKAHFHEDPAVRQASREKYRCKNYAHWVFVDLSGRVRVVCWSHLAVAISSMEEDERWQRWAKDHWPFPRPEEDRVLAPEPNDQTFTAMRNEMVGILDFEPTDEELGRIFVDYLGLVLHATEWGWEDTEVRAELCTALEEIRHGG